MISTLSSDCVDFSDQGCESKSHVTESDIKIVISGNLVNRLYCEELAYLLRTSYTHYSSREFR